MKYSLHAQKLSKLIFPPCCISSCCNYFIFLFISLFILFLSRDKIFTYKCNFELKEKRQRTRKKYAH